MFLTKINKLNNFACNDEMCINHIVMLMAESVADVDTVILVLSKLMYMDKH